VLYSGRDDNQHQEGVAVILKKRMKNMVDGMEYDQQQTDEGQNEWETHQHYHHPVLLTDQ